MSEPKVLYSVDQWNVDACHRPLLVGPNRWAVGEETYSPKDADDVVAEIGKTLARVAKLEAVRQAMEDVDTCVVYDRADEICRAIYGVDLPTFDRNGGKVYVKALFLMAQRELEREAHPLQTMVTPYGHVDPALEVPGDE